MEALIIMRALDPEVVDTVWAAIKHLLPAHIETHPLGCHRGRVPDRVCFEVMLVRLVTGCSWEDAERLCGNKVSDTTARARRDEWEHAGVFDAIAEEAIHSYDKIIGLDLSEVAVDGSLHKSPTGGEGTGKNPTDRAKLGWKWSILTDKNGIPIGWAVDGANRHDSVMLEPTLDDAQERGLLVISRPSGSTGAMTLSSHESACAALASTMPSSPRSERAMIHLRPRSFRWGCGGRLNARTHGSRTTARYGATRTAKRSTAWLSWPSRLPSF
jgi:transposase